MRRVLGLVAAALLLVGCKTTEAVQQDATALRDAPGCCPGGAADFSYTRLSFGEAQRAIVDHSRKVYDFPAPAEGRRYGKSYFVAYALPAATQRYQIELWSPYRSEGMFFPLAILYDENFNPVEWVRSTSFAWKSGGWTGRDRNEIRWPVRPELKARYLAVFTSADLIATGRVRSEEMTTELTPTLRGRTGYYTGVSVPGAPVGEFWIGLTPMP